LSLTDIVVCEVATLIAVTLADLAAAANAHIVFAGTGLADADNADVVVGI
jgi:hypothetical protein